MVEEGEPRKLSARKRLVAELLAAGWGQGEAAAFAGVSTRSVRRWMHEDADFRRAIRFEGRLLVAETQARFRAAQGRAFDTLMASMSSGPAWTRLAAARAVLAAAQKYDFEELEDRLDDVEASMRRKESEQQSG